MKNYLQAGAVLSLLAPYAVAAGVGCKVGSIIGVTTAAAGNGAAVDLAVVGVFEVAKVSAQAWTVGLAIYWDDSAKLFTSTASTNTLAGVAVAAAANPTATGVVSVRGRGVRSR
jgi:predicted RecA/RadA family phage recombinase